MKLWIPMASLGLASLAPAQRFGFTHQMLPADNDTTQAVALGDVDGDGDLDAFVGNDWEPIRLYLNDGTGIFSDVTATNLPDPIEAIFEIELGDVDGDGDLDAFVGNAGPNTGGQDRLYLNGGTGIFADVTPTNLPAVTGWTNAVALGDVDEDGDLDAFLASTGPSSGGQERLYLNGGTGSFTDATAMDLPALVDQSTAVALGDVDGDGDLDAFVGNLEEQSQLYTNVTRQVSWRGVPRAGKVLALDLRGPLSGTWLLAASDASASIPIPPVGTLRLFPPTLFIVAGGFFDPQGRADLTFPVPANPALVGGSLYWQAVVGPPLRFTNLEITTVTGL